MALFGGLDLGTPADRNKHAMTRELELRRKRTPHSGHGRVYLNGADFLLKHGKFYEGREMPDRYAHLMGQMGLCFWNAAAAAEADPTLRYCEGITGVGGGRFVAHAWVLDPDGNVVDLTYSAEAVGIGVDFDTGLPLLPIAHWSYWGVIFTPELMRAHHEIGYPMLGRDVTEQYRPGQAGKRDLTPPPSLPVLDVPYDPNRKELP